MSREAEGLNTCALILAVVLLGGCAAVWGQPYKVEFASSSSITINFDPSLTNIGEVQNVAQTHCDKFGKDAVPQGGETSPWGLRNVSFRCEHRSGRGSGEPEKG